MDTSNSPLSDMKYVLIVLSNRTVCYVDVPDTTSSYFGKTGPRPVRGIPASPNSRVQDPREISLGPQESVPS